MKLLLNLLLTCFTFSLAAQPVTGIWRGKITSGKGKFANVIRIELKLIKKADSLYGTAYYYNNSNNFIRYSIKGRFDEKTNVVKWQDDKLLEVKPKGAVEVGVYDGMMASRADFNCPGNKIMMLDGTSKIGTDGPDFTLHYDKMDDTMFPDEWDPVIEGYFTGMNDPDIIDSVFAISKEYVPEASNDLAKESDRQRRGRNRSGGVPATETAAVTASTPPANTQKADESPAAIAKNNDPAGKKPEEIAKESAPPVSKSAPPATNAPDLVKNEKSTDVVSKPAVQSTPVPPPPVEKPAPSVAKNEPPKTQPVTRERREPPVATQNPTTNQAPANAPVTASVEQPKSSVPSNTGQPVAGNNSSEPGKDDIAKSNSGGDSRDAGKMLSSVGPVPIVIEKTGGTAIVDPVAVEKFSTRKKIEQAEIPMLGDTVELNFYDNAEVDGDSISLFLNGKLLFNHVRLTTQAYTFKIPLKDLADGSELTMVAENLGAIPPNTAYMMAVVDGQRYSARLESTEQTSGVIKLVRRQKP